MRNFWLSVSGVLGALAVGLGAFGAHGLKERITPDMLTIYEVGVRYHVYHALAILAVSPAVGLQPDSPWLRRACGAWCAGIIIFSGSLYALAISGEKWLGAITPIGGVAFIAGWCMLVAAGRSYRGHSA